MEETAKPRQRKHFVYTDHIGAYASFFEADWGKLQLNRAAGTLYEDQVFALLATWKSLSAAHAMPAIMLRTMAEGLNGTLQGYPGFLIKILDGFEQGLDMCLAQHPLKPRQRELIHNLIETLRGKMIEKVDEAQKNFTPEALWKYYTVHHDVTASLAATAQSGYLGLYFAYEHFLTDCVRQETGEPDYYWSKTNDFGKKLVEVWGEPIHSVCWADAPVIKARLVRNAFAHNGGRITKLLAPYRSQLLLDETDTMMIPATEVTALYKLLRDKVGVVIDKGGQIPTGATGSVGAAL